MTWRPPPPRLAQWLARALLPARDREIILGDLDELFARRVSRDGLRRARRWYWRNAAGSVLARRSPAILVSRWSDRHRGDGSARAGFAFARAFGMAGAARSLRLACRSLWRTPVFTLAALLTVAIGVGANAAVFGIADRVMFRPVAGVGDPDDLALVWFATADNTRQRGTSYANIADLRSAVVGRGAIDGLAAHITMGLHVVGGDAVPVALMGAAVVGDYFDALRARVVRGRLFTAEESGPGAAAIAVIGEDLWRTRYGADPDIAGRRILVNRQPLTIVGVVGGGFQGTERYRRQDVWVPGGLYGALRHFEDPVILDGRGRSVYRELLVRLADGAEPSAAQAQLRSAMARLVDAHPEANEPHARYPPTVYPGIGLDVMARARTAATVRLMMTVVTVVLLIACANVANLLLVRAAKRRGETAVRRALGASAARLLGHQLAEASVIGVAGGLLGLVFAAVIGRLFGTASLVGVGGAVESIVDGRVFVFALAVSLLATVLFGVAPGLVASRTDPAAGLREAGRRDTGRHHRMRAAMTVLQLALSLVLLVGALLLTRTLANLQRVELGFKPAGVVSFIADLEPQGYDRTEGQVFLRGLLARMAGLPGMTAVAVSQRAPFFGSPLGSRIVDPRGDGSAAVEVDIDFVSEAYFRTVGLRVQHGRGLRASDRGVPRDGPHNVVLSAALARRLFGHEAAAVGRRLRTQVMTPADLHVVGVVEDARTVRVSGDVDEIVYQMVDTAPLSMSVLVLARTDLATARAAELFADVVRALESGLPITRVERLSDKLDAQLAEQRLLARLLALFSAIALALAAIGLYGVIASAVTERTREIGVRVALGARRGRIVALMLGQTAVVVAPGLALGLASAAALVRVLESRLFGVTPLDPTTHATAASLLVAVAFVAVLAPTRAATRVDPMSALRHE